MAVVLLAAGAVIAEGPYTITDLSPVGATRTWAVAINNLGQVAGYSELADGRFHGMLWDSGSMTDLGTLGGNTYAEDINATGQVVGYSFAAGSVHAFVWEGGTMTELRSFEPPAGNYSNAYGIDGRGRVVGLAVVDSSGHTHATIWDGMGIADLGTLGGSSSNAYAINDAGHVVGYSRTTDLDPVHACVWDGSAITDLGTLGGSTSIALGINAPGQVTGYAFTSTEEYRACLWEKDGSGWSATDLGTLGGDYSVAEGINDLGWVVGQAKDAGGVRRACLWRDGEIIDLNSLLPVGSGWTLVSAFGVNEAGWIVGTGTFQNGETHAYLLTPEPATLSLLALGGLAMMRRRR